MSIDPAALNQPTVLDLSQQGLIALDKKKRTILLHLVSVHGAGVREL